MSDFSALGYIKKTRCERSCCWCGELIPKAAAAWKIASRRDGEFSTDYLHPECLQANQRLTADERDELRDGWEHGEFERGMTPAEKREIQRQADAAMHYWSR